MTEEKSEPPLIAFVRRHRARLARAALILLGAIVLLDLSSSLPTETTLALDLGDAHEGAVAVEIAVLSPTGEPVRVVRRSHPDGAPETETETLDLTPGRYRVELDLTHRDGSHALLEGSFEAPGEGTTHVALRVAR